MPEITFSVSSSSPITELATNESIDLSLTISQHDFVDNSKSKTTVKVS